MASQVSTYYSPIDFPLTKSIWQTALEAPIIEKTTVQLGFLRSTTEIPAPTILRVAKFALLFFPALIVTALDVTLFNLLRCTVGNVAILLFGNRVTPPPPSTLKSIVSFLNENKMLLFAGAGIVVSFWAVPKMMRYLDGWAAKKITDWFQVDHLEDIAESVKSCEATEKLSKEICLKNKIKTLGSCELIAGLMGKFAAKMFDKGDFLGIPSLAISAIQSGWKNYFSPTLSSVDAKTGKWLSFLVLSAPWTISRMMMPLAMIYQFFPDMFPANFEKYVQYISLASTLSSWNVFLGPVLSASSPLSGVYNGAKNYLLQYYIYPIVYSVGIGIIGLVPIGLTAVVSRVLWFGGSKEA
jgi:hypothetical protein